MPDHSTPTPLSGEDRRIYHSDPKTYKLVSRRFPEGVEVRRYYSLTDCAAEVVQLLVAISGFPTWRERAYALPHELTEL